MPIKTEKFIYNTPQQQQQPIVECVLHSMVISQQREIRVYIKHSYTYTHT